MTFCRSEMQPNWSGRFIMTCKTGMHRVVWFVGRWVLKFPRIHLLHYTRFFPILNPRKLKEWAESWSRIAGGNFEVNRNEGARWRASKNKESYGIPLCPIRFCLPYGLLVVMRRAEPLNRALTAEEKSLGFQALDGDGLKPDSYGLLDGQLVAIDYGGMSSAFHAQAAEAFRRNWR